MLKPENKIFIFLYSNTNENPIFLQNFQKKLKKISVIVSVFEVKKVPFTTFFLFHIMGLL